MRGHERVRIVVHARNTEAECDALVAHLLRWVALMQEKEGRSLGARAAVANAPAIGAKPEVGKMKMKTAQEVHTARIGRGRLSVDMSVRVLA